MAIKYITPKDAAQVDTLIGKAIKSVAKARVDVQVAAVAILIHAEKHGDYTKANELVVGLGNTINGKALVEWFVVYGGLTIDEESEAFSGWKGAEHIRAKFQEAKAKMWWDLKQQKPFSGFNLEEALQRVLRDHKKATKDIDKLSEEDKGKIKVKANDDTIKAILSLCNFEAIVEG